MIKSNKYNWLTLTGNYEIKNNSIKFIGEEFEGEDNNRFPLIGNCLSDQYFDGGKITANIEFKVVDEEIGCDILINYINKNNKLEFTSVGIDKSKYGLFELKSYRDGKWEYHQIRGNGNALHANQKYKLEVEYIGNRVMMKVNGVQVIDYNLPYNTSRSQVGIWNRSKSIIEISDYEVESIKSKVFVVMQFSTQFNELYEDVIKPVCQEFGYEVIRADDMYTNGMIISDIANSIVESKVIIADVTPQNPNVYYEVGYAHALQKNTILLAEEGCELPFDIKPFRVVFYKNTINGKTKVENTLRSHLNNLL